MSDVLKPVEVELKLILSGIKDETAVVEFLQQHGYDIKKSEPLENIDIYMDTSDWSLLKNKLSLRYRVSKGKAMYTLKSVGAIKDGIAKRMEDEILLKTPAHAPTDIPIKTLRKQINEIIFPRKLMEQILIRTRRNLYMTISPEGTKLELAFDISSFSADALFKPRRAPRLYEFEAEVVKGPETALESLASLLSEAFGYPPSKTSKMETAMTRLKIEPLVKKVPDDLKITLDDRLDRAIKKILATEFHWFHEQLPGVISDRDPEFVHQARVTIRRMRSALILFHGALTENTYIYLEEHLNWLGKLFGAVRDLDVFIINLNSYKNRIESYSKAKRKALETLVVKQRRAPLKSLNEALKSRRYMSFERRMIKLLDSPQPRRTEVKLAAKPVREIAPQVITRKFESVVDQNRKTLANPSLKEFHCLRIQMKRLRYSFEFMAPSYGDAFNDIIKRSVEVQDCLGELQDTVFNQKLIKNILKDWQGKIVDPELVFILGEIYQRQGEIAQERQKTFAQIWECFNPEQTGDSLKQIFQEYSVANRDSK